MTEPIAFSALAALGRSALKSILTIVASAVVSARFPMRISISAVGFRRLLSVALLLILVAPSGRARSLAGDQSFLAMWVETAIFAAQKCRGMHVIPGAIRRNIDAADVTPDQMLGGEWTSLMRLAEANDAAGFTRDPPGFCSRTWQAVGADHLSVRFPMLVKD
jgi:hypothetical protein